MDGEKTDSGRVDTGDDEIGANMSLVAEQVLFEHGHASDDARGAACGEGVQFEIGADEGGGEFGVCCCSSAGAPDFRGDVVKFFAVLNLIEWLISR